MSKKIFIFLLIAIMLYSSLLMPMPAYAATGVSVMPATRTVATSTAFSVIIRANEVVDLHSTSFILNYTGSLLTFQNASIGSFMKTGCAATTTINADVIPGTLEMDISRETCAGVDGSGNIVILNFLSSDNLGTSSLSFAASSSLLNSSAEEIITDWNGGEVIVSDNPPSIATATFYLDPAVFTVALGGEYEVTLSVADATGLADVITDINYDDSILTYSHAVAHGLFDNFLFMDTPSAGTVNIWANTEMGTIDGNADIATLYFTAAQVGNSDLTLTNGTASDEMFGELPATWVNASVTVEDQTAPEDIIDLAIEITTATTTALTWTAPGDDGSAGTAAVYDIRYATSTISTSTWDSLLYTKATTTPQAAGLTENYTITGLDDNTAYYFVIKTSDEATNESGLSNVVSTTTLDATPPTRANGAPTGALSAGATQTELSLTTDEEAICRYSAVADTAFADMVNIITDTATTTHATTTAGLTNGQSYSYYVRCQDTNNNANTDDYSISFSVASPGPICGDGACNGSETCSSCSQDCGSCGGGGGGSYTPPSDTTPPAQPTEFKVERDEEKVSLGWKNSLDSDFAQITLIRTTEMIFDYYSFQTIKDIGEVLFEGADESFIDDEIIINLSYYYALFAADTKGNYSTPIIIQKNAIQNQGDNIQGSAGSSAGSHGGITSLAGAVSDVVEVVSLTEAQTVFDYNRHVSLNEATEKLYLFIINKSPHDLIEQDKHALAYFIHSGTPTTQVLGAGERTGVVNSYLTAFSRLPRGNSEWQDVIKIANGRWPTERNLGAENNAQQKYFAIIYKREPNMSNPNDNAAVTVIAYGLRPANRNLDSEKAAIKIFKAIHGHNPSSAADWDITRAIAYSGAVR